MIFRGPLAPRDIRETDGLHGIYWVTSVNSGEASMTAKTWGSEKL